MQYIEKTALPPANWDLWFTTANGRRSYDYRADNLNLPDLHFAKDYLLNEQNYLCAYCQTQLTSATSSIEHQLPKGFNIEQSTNYHNLVAVCLNTPSDPDTDRHHCDQERGSVLLPPIVQYQNAQVSNLNNHGFFIVYSSGFIVNKPHLDSSTESQVEAFINVLNLNHSSLVYNRAQTLNGILTVFNLIAREDKRAFLELQRNRIFHMQNQEYRQFLLIYLSTKLGIN